MKVVFATPSLSQPTKHYIEALEASIPLIKEAGWEEGYLHKAGCPYISFARAELTRQALDANADVIIYLDYDLSWDAPDLLTLLETRADVVAGTYRFKVDEESYMGTLRPSPGNLPIVRPDGCILADWVPAGFLKVTVGAIEKIMANYPELLFGSYRAPHVDLFNHGAHKRIWYGEDYAFSRRWNDLGEQVWIRPNLNITHHSPDKAYPGNFHEYLLRQPGGSNEGK